MLLFLQRRQCATKTSLMTNTAMQTTMSHLKFTPQPVQISQHKTDELGQKASKALDAKCSKFDKPRTDTKSSSKNKSANMPAMSFFHLIEDDSKTTFYTGFPKWATMFDVF